MSTATQQRGCSLQKASEILHLSYNTLRRKGKRAELGLIEVRPHFLSDYRTTTLTLDSVMAAAERRRQTAQLMGWDWPPQKK